MGGHSLTALIFLLAIVLAGCAGDPPVPATTQSARDSLRAQIAAVEKGEATSIKIENGAIDDRDMELLAGLTELQALVLQGPSEISDAGLAHLQELKKLKTLNIHRTTISDDGLASLARLTKLEMLRLGSSRVRGPGLAHLAGLVELRHLILQRAPLADDGLAHLHSLTKLESLYVEETEITPEGLKELQRALPSLGHVHPHF